MLDWDNLRSFLELARRGKLSMAGKRLNVEPTTVGRHIYKLEKELGIHLFDRSPKGYSLTKFLMSNFFGLLLLYTYFLFA